MVYMHDQITTVQQQTVYSQASIVNFDQLTQLAI